MTFRVEGDSDDREDAGPGPELLFELLVLNPNEGTCNPLCECDPGADSEYWPGSYRGGMY